MLIASTIAEKITNLKIRTQFFYEKGPLAAAKIGTQNDMWGIFCNYPFSMISIFEACWIKSNS